MAKVYHAFDPVAEREYAIKVLRVLSLATEAEISEIRLRFQSEILALSRLSPHPHIPIYYHGGQDGDTQYFVMELVAGCSLIKEMAAGRSFRPDDASRIVRQISVALDYAHGKGIVHRDIKPSNVMVQADGTVKIIDFGIARVDSQNLTVTGQGWGTPAYMAPERIMGKEVGGPADQFSLAVLTYQLLTGKMPFTGQDDVAVQNSVLHAEPPPPTRVNSSLRWRVDGVLRRALAKAPEDRFRTCGEFAAALDAALLSGRLGPDPADVTRRTQAPQDYTHRSHLSAARQTEVSSRRKIALASLTFLVIAGLAMWVKEPHAVPPPPAGPSTTAGDPATPSTPSRSPAGRHDGNGPLPYGKTDSKGPSGNTTLRESPTENAITPRADTRPILAPPPGLVLSEEFKKRAKEQAKHIADGFREVRNEKGERVMFIRDNLPNGMIIRVFPDGHLETTIGGRRVLPEKRMMISPDEAVTFEKTFGIKFPNFRH
jgi:serine/threonine-protein kinase